MGGHTVNSRESDEQRRKGCLIAIALVVVLWLILALAEESRRNQKWTPNVPLPGEIVQFFEKYRQELSRPAGTNRLPDWRWGPRYRVFLDDGRNLVFYLKAGEVWTVYEDLSNGHRVKVWGDYEDSQ